MKGGKAELRGSAILWEIRKYKVKRNWLALLTYEC